MKIILTIALILCTSLAIAGVEVTEKAEQPDMGYIVYEVKEIADYTDADGTVFKNVVLSKFDTTEANVDQGIQQLEDKIAELQALLIKQQGIKTDIRTLDAIVE